jgi:ABC-2 type transport system permease protein
MTRVEFAKQLLRPRTYLLLGILYAFPALLTLLFRFGNPGEHAGTESFIALAPNSGPNMAVAILEHVSDLILPFLGVVLAGSIVAEEASWGSLAYLLTRPVTRERLLGTKLLVAAVLILVAAALVTLLAVVDGLIAFGWRTLETPSGSTLPAGTALARVAIAAPYMAWSLAAIMSAGFLVSSLSNSPLYGAAAGFGLAAVSQILNSLSVVGDVRSILPTHYWKAWEGLFANPANWDDLLMGLAIQLPYVIILLVLAFLLFHRRDILT